MRKTTAGLAAVAISLFGTYAASAEDANDPRCNGSERAAHCDMDGDGTINKDDDDIDGDGIANGDDTCPKDATDACGSDGGGEDPGTPGLPVPARPALPALPI